MKLKVCGLKHPGNVNQLFKEVNPDYAGFIFYAASPRYAANLFCEMSGIDWDNDICKTGVFVNSSEGCIMNVSYKLGIEMVQLHGDETVRFCAGIQEKGLSVIKSFSVDNDFDFSKLKPYCKVVDYFLFDTKAELRGGNGKKFNWLKLQEYPFEKPYFLSGGISPGDAKKIIDLNDKRMVAVDINSRFEIEPGKKDVKLIQKFYKQLNHD
jgi:phosphoribosylanthranilate isomerase